MTPIIRDATASRNKIFLELLRLAKLPEPHQEYKFHSTRKWKFDWAWPLYGVALEQEGGAYSGGRHTRGKGFTDDCVKYSEAAAMGWLVIRVPPSDLCSEQTLDWIRRAMHSERGMP